MDSGPAPSGASRNDGRELLPVIRQNLLTGLAEPRAVLLETPEDDHIAVIHMSPAKPRHIPRAAGVRPSALRRGRGDDQEKNRNGEQKSGHLECLYNQEHDPDQMWKWNSTTAEVTDILQEIESKYTISPKQI
jgi:hypothetical protein